MSGGAACLAFNAMGLTSAAIAALSYSMGDGYPGNEAVTALFGFAAAVLPVTGGLLWCGDRDKPESNTSSARPSETKIAQVSGSEEPSKIARLPLLDRPVDTRPLNLGPEGARVFTFDPCMARHPAESPEAYALRMKNARDDYDCSPCA